MKWLLLLFILLIPSAAEGSRIFDFYYPRYHAALTYDPETGDSSPNCNIDSTYILTTLHHLNIYQYVVGTGWRLLRQKPCIGMEGLPDTLALPDYGNHYVTTVLNFNDIERESPCPEVIYGPLPTGVEPQPTTSPKKIKEIRIIDVTGRLAKNLATHGIYWKITIYTDKTRKIERYEK